MIQSDHPTITFDELVSLGADCVVLTVNNRLARRLTAEFAQWLQQRGLAACPAPEILPFSAWIDTATETLAFAPDAPLPSFRLDAFGAQLVWHEAIEAEGGELLDVRECARLAAEAEHLVREWQVETHGHPDHVELNQFLAWRERYHALLRQYDADDAEARFDHLLQALANGQLSLRSHVVLAGTRELSPRQRQLCRLLATRGCSVYRYEDTSCMHPERPRLVAADDRFDEWQRAVAWACEQLASPQRKVAIVAASLQADAAHARRVLSRMLPADAYNVSVGRPLIEWPLARAGLAWLKLLLQPLPYRPEEAGLALLEGHCAGHSEEAGTRAFFDAHWRLQACIAVDDEEWQRLLSACPRLASAWQEARVQAEAWRNTRASAATWSERFRALLQKLGFPGLPALDSTAYQVCQAFDALLQHLATLAPIRRSLRASEACQLLGRLAQESPFQPERPHSARLDVLGLLEAEGGHWDAVWIMGLTDKVLPAPPSPNPLLPVAALAAAHAPRATAQRELKYAQDLFAALMQCAPHIVVSYPCHDNGEELSPSPLIASLADPETTSADDRTTGEAVVQGTVPAAPLETLEHDPGPPLSADSVIHGGAQILDAQARCPLWAFVRHRLGARELPGYAQEPPLPLLRGQFLHAALEYIWSDLRDSDALARHIAQGTLSELVDAALEHARAIALSSISPAFAELEKQRARHVLAQWFAQEAVRPPFAVLHLENEQAWSHGALTLHLRLDRVDRLEDGSLAILDYKTGSQIDIRGWVRDRPINLQLPLYAVALQDTLRSRRTRQAGATIAGRSADVTAQSSLDLFEPLDLTHASPGTDGPPGDEISAIILVRLTARDPTAAGVGRVETGLPDVIALGASDQRAQRGVAATLMRRSWQDWLNHWRSALTHLAEEFNDGRADNIVADENDIEYCDVRPFLRRNLVHDDESR